MANKTNSCIKIFLITVITAVCFFSKAFCQSADAPQHPLIIQYVDKDSSFKGEGLKLQTTFANQALCLVYINKLPSQLQLQGYIAASVDSIALDSVSTFIALYLGPQQKWIQLAADSVDKKALDAGGFFSGNFTNKPVNFGQVQVLKERILNYFENNGYPFAAVYLDSIRIAVIFKVVQYPFF